MFQSFFFPTVQHVYELQKQNLNTDQGLHNDWLWILMYVELTTEKYETFIQIDIRNLFWTLHHLSHNSLNLQHIISMMLTLQIAHSLVA